MTARPINPLVPEGGVRPGRVSIAMLESLRDSLNRSAWVVASRETYVLGQTAPDANGMVRVCLERRTFDPRGLQHG